MVVSCTHTHIETTLYTIAQFSPREAITEVALCRKVKYILVRVVFLSIPLCCQASVWGSRKPAEGPEAQGPTG